jgi:hypothetical protein
MVLTRASLSVVAVALIAFAAQLHLVASRAQEWSPTRGVVVESYIRKIGAGNAAEAGDTDTYSPVVRYEYRVGSDAYASSKIGFGDLFYNWFSAKSRIQAFPKGSTVTVYFDREDPSSAVLDRTYPSVAIAMLVAIAALCFLGAAFLANLVRMAMDALIPQRRRNT